VSDITERLRNLVYLEQDYDSVMEAADEIDRLRAELYDAQSGELKNALAVGQCCIELQESRKEIDSLRAELDALRGQDPVGYVRWWETSRGRRGDIYETSEMTEYVTTHCAD